LSRSMRRIPVGGHRSSSSSSSSSSSRSSSRDVDVCVTAPADAEQCRRLRRQRRRHRRDYLVARGTAKSAMTTATDGPPVGKNQLSPTKGRSQVDVILTGRPQVDVIRRPQVDVILTGRPQVDVILTGARPSDERAPIKMVDGRPWSPGVYRALRLLGRSLETAWEKAFIRSSHF
jgi:hypothetical protein